MNELAEELLKQLLEAFEDEFTNDKKLNKLYELINSGKGDYQKSFEFATETGNVLADVFGKIITRDALETSYLPREIAELIISPMLQQNYRIVSNICEMVQTALNKKANIGLKAVVPAEDYDRENGIVSEVNNYTNLQQQVQHLQSSSRNYTQSVNDNWVRTNADQQYKYGLSPKIIRTAVGGCCEWCQEVADTYDYQQVKNTGNDVFRRHKNCDCLVVYDPADGSKTYQNVWSKQLIDDAEYEKEVNDRIRFSNNNSSNFNNSAQRYGLKCEDVTYRYYDDATPGKGNITLQDGYDLKMHDLEKEWEMPIAKLLHRRFGGDITLLAEINENRVKTADYLWNESLWELKSPSNYSGINSRLRKALQQINNNPGGVIINLGNRKNIDWNLVYEYMSRRLSASWDNDSFLDVMIVARGKVSIILRYSK